MDPAEPPDESLQIPKRARDSERFKQIVGLIKHSVRAVVPAAAFSLCS